MNAPIAASFKVVATLQVIGPWTQAPAFATVVANDPKTIVAPLEAVSKVVEWRGFR